MLAFICPRTHHSLVEALLGPVSAWGGEGVGGAMGHRERKETWRPQQLIISWAFPRKRALLD